MRWQSSLVAVLVVAFVGLWSVDAEAQRTRTAQVPVQVGVGPAGNMMGGPTFEDGLGWGGRLYDDQAIHSGLKIDIRAVISGELVRQHPGMVPRQYRSQIQQSGEVRYAPGIVSLIPTSLFLSPPIGDASAWGATWSLLGLGVPFTPSPVRTSARGAVITTAMYIDSPSVADHYVFLRPGVELKVDVEFQLAEDFLISVGWASQVYLPQDLDGGILSAGGFDEDSLWHIGQFYIQGHLRIPYAHEYVERR